MDLMRNMLLTKKRLLITIVVVVLYMTCNFDETKELSEEDRMLLKRQEDESLEHDLKEDKGTGCSMPKIDPFAKEVTKFDKTYPPFQCGRKDWVQCYHSKCKVDSHILKTMKYVECSYREIIYVDDFQYSYGPKAILYGAQEYHLTKSDCVKVHCKAKMPSHKNISVLEYIIGTPTYYLKTWGGYVLGLRPVEPRKPPAGRENNLNVLMFAFDSVSRNAFIRHMPKSLKFLKEEMNAVVLENYNILGDGTPAALFPLLTGRTEWELPEYRRNVKYSGVVDPMSFIFYKLKINGYRTAYFEDKPDIGTFQLDFNGFQREPADHSVRHYFSDDILLSLGRKRKYQHLPHCSGGRPIFQSMVNITEQFLQLDGHKYVFTLSGDLTHDDNILGLADEPFAEFLSGLVQQGQHRNTLIVVMGDHGPRYTYMRHTHQGIFEERLPFVAIRLPEELTERRPGARAALEANAGVLTTAHDIYTTVLDALDLRQYWSRHKVKGADLPRGLTLLEPIPKSRSCSEAGVLAHWCACLQWAAVDEGDPMYERAARALVDHINALTDFLRSKCAIRTLTTIHWVNIKKPSKTVFHNKSVNEIQNSRRDYQIKITVGPGASVYEATVTHLVEENSIIVPTNSISRTNSYKKEPACISATYPNFKKFCYCH